MKALTKSDFIAEIKNNEDDTWPEPERLAAALELHLPNDRNVIGWMWLDRGESHAPASGTLAIVGERRFSIVGFTRGHHRDRPAVMIESVSITKLRYVRTSHYGEGNGGFELGFAAGLFDRAEKGVLDTRVHFHQNEGWPTQQVRHFLQAIAEVRS